MGNKMKNNKHGTVPKSNGKIVESGKIDTPITQMHDHSFYWLGIDTLLKVARLNSFLRAQTWEMLQNENCNRQH